MKSVCFVVQNVYDFDPRVRRKAEALVAAGFSVDVLALRPSDGKKSYVLNGVNVRTVSLGKKRGSLARYFLEYATFFLWTFVRVTLQMLRRRYAVIDVNSLPDFLIFAPVLARWMGAKLILDLHEIMPEFYMSKYRHCGELVDGSPAEIPGENQRQICRPRDHDQRADRGSSRKSRAASLEIDDSHERGRRGSLRCQLESRPPLWLRGTERSS